MFAAVAAMAFLMCAFSAFIVLDDVQETDAVAFSADFDVDLGTVTVEIGEEHTVDLDSKFTEVYENPRTNWGTAGNRSDLRDSDLSGVPNWITLEGNPGAFKDSDLSGLNTDLIIKPTSSANSGTFLFSVEYTLYYGLNMVHATFNCTIHVEVPTSGESGDTATIRFVKETGSQEMVDRNVSMGSTVQLPTRLFTKEGYYLQYWVDTEGSTIAPGSNLQINSDLELTGQWAKGSGECKGELVFTPGYPVSIRAADYIDGTGSISVSENCPWLSVSNNTITGTASEPGIWVIQLTQSVLGIGETKTWFTVVVTSTMDTVYQISFDMNGGSGSVDTVEVPHGTGIVLPGADVTSWPGGTKYFVGWEIIDAYNNRGTFPPESLYVFDAECTVKAVWYDTPNVLVYSMDGGSLENVYADVTYSGQSTTLRDDAVKDGYVFLGWKVSQDQSLVYAPNTTTTFSGPVYLEAYFVKEGTQVATVNYSAGKGSIMPTSQSVEAGKYVVLPTDLMVQAPPGYVFVGWSTQAPADSSVIADDREVITTEHYYVSGDVTLYAVYEEQGGGGTDPPMEDAEFSVTFRTMGGDGSYPQQIVKNGNRAEKPEDPSKDGNIFLGWALQGTTDVWDFDTPITGNTILYAMWDECFTITYSQTEVDGRNLPTITVNVLGEYASYESVVVYWGEVGSKVETVVNGTASHTYNYTSYGYIVVTLTQSGVEHVVRMPFSVEADHYNPTSTKTVVFNSMGGSTVPSQTVEINGYAVEPVAPTKNGFVFDYWADLTGKEFDFSTPIRTDIILYAMWTDKPQDVEEDELVAFFTLTTTNYGWLADGSASQNAVTWTWMLNGVEHGEGQTLRIESSDLEAGSYSIQLVVTDADGNKDTSDAQKFTVGSDPEVEPVIPKASFTMEEEDGVIVFDASASEKANRYQWVVDGSIVSNQGPYFEFSTEGLQPGTHSVTLTVFSVTQNSHSMNDSFTIEAQQGGDDGDGPDWVLIAAIVIVVIVIIIIVARFVI